MSSTITESVTLVTVDCGECGGTYALNQRYHEQQREHGGFWNCPYCRCEWGFPEDGSVVAQLKRKLEYAEADYLRERKSHDYTERRLSATQGVVTRTKNRFRNGVCPCCHRTFQNLARHMGTKHPEYAPLTGHVAQGIPVRLICNWEAE